MTTEALTEEEKMRRVPGIIFVDGAAGRRARVEGTGIEVFEIILTYRGLDYDRAALDDYFYWLTPAQVKAAVDYYALFPDEINVILQEYDEAYEEYLRTGPRIYSSGRTGDSQSTI